MAILNDSSLPKGNEGMILLYERKDDQTYKLPDIPFAYKYNQKDLNSIYVCGNTWIGFGASTEHLAINRRDTSYNKLYYVNEEEYGLQTYRIRFEGNSVYNSWNSNDLVWEFTIFEDGVFRLVVEASPNSAADKFLNPNGTSLTIPFMTGKSYVFISKNKDGTDYEIFEGSYIPSNNKYLMQDSEGIKSYRSSVGQWIKVGELPLTKQVFLDEGIDELPNDLTGLSNGASLCFYTDNPEILINKEHYIFNVQLTVTSHPKLLIQLLDFELDRNRAIKQIELRTAINGGMIKAAFSPDRGINYYTWNIADEEFEVVDINDVENFLENGITSNMCSLIDYSKLQLMLNNTIRFAYIFEKPTLNDSCKLKAVKLLYE